VASQYGKALPILKGLIAQDATDPWVNYQLGICYFNSTTQKLKAIPYWEAAAAQLNSQVPSDVHYWLGKVYLLSYRFVDAANAFNMYKETSAMRGQPLARTDVDHLITMCSSAQELYQRPRVKINVSVLPSLVNTSFDEWGALVPQGGELMIFGSDRPQNTFKLVYNDEEFLNEMFPVRKSDVFMAGRHGIDWAVPYPIELTGPVVMPLSLSNDGSSMLLYIGEDLMKGDIYVSSVKKSKWTSPKKLSSVINSKYDEMGASFASNGDVIYFSSNRPGGYGGYDIYKTLKNGKDWTEPINLGPSVNSAFDEVTPFIHPDNKTLYFSSDGHNSMGGYDVFVSRLSGASWGKPDNLGYPINTPFNEINFMMQNGKSSFLASDRIENTSLGGYDIVSIFTPEVRSPLAMISGAIHVTENGNPVPVSLHVSDSLGKDTRYVYNPDPKTGKYFMIVSPRNTYRVDMDMGKGRRYSILLNIPEGTYSYNLNYDLELNPIKVVGQSIGSQVSVKKSSLQVTRFSDLAKIDSVRETRYDALMMLMEQIVDRSDATGFASLDKLEQKMEFAMPGSQKQSNVEEYYTPLVDKVDLAMRVGDASLINKLEEPLEVSDRTSFFDGKTLPMTNKKMVFRYSVQFKEGKTALTDAHKKAMDEIGALLRLQPGLLMHIEWAYQPSGAQEDGTFPQECLQSLKNNLKANGINTYRYKVQQNEKGAEPVYKASGLFMADIVLYEQIPAGG
jgi:hypothetical protein